MGNLRSYYLEIISSTCVGIAAIYCFSNFYQQNQTAMILKEIQTKVVLAENRKQRIIEEKISEEKNRQYFNYFETILKKSGLEVIKIAKDETNMLATVYKDSEALNKLAQNLNVHYKENEKTVEIVWNYTKSALIAKSIEHEELKINAVCFFAENDWQIWINNKMYDSKHNMISENVYIKNVSNDSVTISEAGNLYTIYL